MQKENYDEAMKKFLEPFAEYINIASDKTSEMADVKRAVRKIRQYEGEDIPHDFGLYIDEIKQLKEQLELNFSIEEFPELWL